jgi:branched-chain amino acid transport system ATP-binding protein
MLKTEKLNVHYGKAHILHDIEVEIQLEEIVALIGRNGAGKTTILKTITGLVSPSSGHVYFGGSDITNKPAHSIVKMGLSHVPEGRQIFPDQTVADNLVLGGYIKGRKDKQRIKILLDREYQRFPILSKRRKQMAGTMSGGEQQMLAISRGLMSDPKFMVLDEPSLGLAPLIVKDIMEIISGINREGITVLLVEQMATAALSISQRAYVLQTGQIKLSGKASELLNDPEVKKSYLGQKD